MNKLTLVAFDIIPSSSVMTSGYTTDNPEGINMTNSGKQLKWVSVKGAGGDWAIYIGWANQSTLYIRQHGDKVTIQKNIDKLVPTEPEVYNKYRF